MASIKVKFRPSEIAGREGSVYYQIIHERKVRQLLSVYRIFPYEWDDRHSAVITATGSDRRYTLLAIREHISHDMERLTRICARLDCRGMQYTADDIINEFNRYTSECSLFNFMGHIIARLQQNGKIRTSETYKATMNSFKKFLASRSERNSEAWNDDIMIDSITGETMEAFEAWHKTRGVSPNTISFYTRILRAVYNRAVEEWSIGDRNPFRHVYTGIDKTVKRALPLAAIKRIKSLNLSHQPMLDYARDMFMMSFYLRGMSFIDMAFLRKSDIRNGYVVYRRRKTGQILTIAWTSEMQLILNKYPENVSDYALPIIRRHNCNERSAYLNASYNINRNLKKVASIAGINMPLTLYVARHSWASAANAKGIPLNVISEGMGHNSETTTRIYLASLDTSIVDRANSIILKSLK